jgi:hypothetical protein
MEQYRRALYAVTVAIQRNILWFLSTLKFKSTRVRAHCAIQNYLEFCDTHHFGHFGHQFARHMSYFRLFLTSDAERPRLDPNFKTCFDVIRYEASRSPYLCWEREGAVPVQPRKCNCQSSCLYEKSNSARSHLNRICCAELHSFTPYLLYHLAPVSPRQEPNCLSISELLVEAGSWFEDITLRV